MNHTSSDRSTPTFSPKPRSDSGSPAATVPNAAPATKTATKPFHPTSSAVE